MEPVDWASVFSVIDPPPGCSDAQLRELAASVSRPLDAEEVAYLSQRLARRPDPPDPRGWPLPNYGLPPSYLSFLAWSNGGRYLLPGRAAEFLPAEGLRNEMLAWLFPLITPGLVPFAATNNPKAWYAFDARRGAADGELPVVYVRSGMCMSTWMPLAPTFMAFCRGTDRGDEAAYQEWWAVHHP